MAENKILAGQLVEEQTVITLVELCRKCIVETTEVITMVEEGILEPAGARPAVKSIDDWRFHISCVRRVRTVVHLRRDLGVNLPGAALALELLDKIAELKAASP
jgi:chaperone modulatory protein CbpM